MKLGHRGGTLPGRRDGGGVRHAEPYAEVRRAPSRVGVRCGTLRTHCPIAAYERAPATTADAAISSTATNG